MIGLYQVFMGVVVMGAVLSLVDKGDAFCKDYQYHDALRCYEEALSLCELEYVDIKERNGVKVIVLQHWADALLSCQMCGEAIEKYKAAWEFSADCLAGDRELDVTRVKILNNWGKAYRYIGFYSLCLNKCQDVWNISKNWGLDDNRSLYLYIPHVLINWAVSLRKLGLFMAASEKYEKAWGIWQEFGCDKDLKDECAVLLMNWSVTLRRMGRYEDAIANCKKAWEVIRDNERNFVRISRLLMIWAHALRESGKANEALEKCKHAWSVSVENTHSHLVPERLNTEMLICWAQILFSLKKYPAAHKKYAYACRRLEVNFELVTNAHSFLVRILSGWGMVLLNMGRYGAAEKKFCQAWDVLTGDLKGRQGMDYILFDLVTNWQSLLPCMPNFHDWSRMVSSRLTDRLGLQNYVHPPHWLDELHQRFARFHLRWMQHCVEQGMSEHLPEILSRVSGWRMAAALLDELELIGTENATAGDINTQTLRDYQYLRLEIRRLAMQIQEKEQAAGWSLTDTKGILRGGGLHGTRRDISDAVRQQPEADIDIHVLRQQYDQTYNQMRHAQQEAARIPGYESLLLNSSVLDAQRLLLSLQPHQALLIVFDQFDDERQQPLCGAVLLAGGQVYWQPVDDMARGSACLQAFEHQITTSRDFRQAVFRRGDTGYVGYAGSAASAVSAPYASKCADSTAEVEDSPPAGLWDELGQWVGRQLWQPLQQQRWLEGVTEIFLVTQGGQAHSIPWQMQAPVAPGHIYRYPGLMFYAMARGLVSRAACDAAANYPRLGIAHYHGQHNPLASAAIEARILGQIWGDADTVPAFNYLQPQGTVGRLHVAGHGSHAPSPDEAVTACLAVEDNTRWGLTQLMGAPARPEQVYLSCCVAGRTTDIAGEQYGVTAALLQHGTREVVACSVPLHDMWGAALSITTHSLMRTEKLSLREALQQAQDMVTGHQPWNVAAWRWVVQSWQQRLDLADEVHGALQQTLQQRMLLARALRQEDNTALIRLLQDNGMGQSVRALEEQLCMQQLEEQHRQLVGEESLQDWLHQLAQALRGVLEQGGGQACPQQLDVLVQQHVSMLAQQLQWPTQAPPLIAGSLRFATWVQGSFQMDTGESGR